MKTLLTILLACFSYLCFSQNDSAQFVKRIGNKGRNKPLSIEYVANAAHKGTNEVGTIISVRKGPVHVVGARFLINDIKMPDSALFIVNIYDLKNGRPTTNGLYRPIKIGEKVKGGTLDVDLAEYNIWKSKDFLLALSWPAGQGNISFGAGLGGRRSFHRSDNEQWEKTPMKLGISATVVSKAD